MNKPSDKILAIDIGGSHIKASILDAEGNLVEDYEKMVTPVPATPASVIDTIKEFVKGFPVYDKISVGFPGYVSNGKIITAPNLGNDAWHNVQLDEQLGNALGKPARVVNDADMQGLGVVSGKGLEMMLTLGTGFGTALLNNGKLLPHIELAHHPVTKKKTYDQYLGDKALEEAGTEKWNKRLQRLLKVLQFVFNYDVLYIGGGNARKIKFELPPNTKIVTNKDGIRGGAILWKD